MVEDRLVTVVVNSHQVNRRMRRTIWIGIRFQGDAVIGRPVGPSLRGRDGHDDKGEDQNSPGLMINKGECQQKPEKNPNARRQTPIRKQGKCHNACEAPAKIDGVSLKRPQLR